MAAPARCVTYSERHFGPGARLTVLGKKAAPGGRRVGCPAWTIPRTLALKEWVLAPPEPLVRGLRLGP